MAIEKPVSGTSESDRNVWIVLAGLLFASVLVAVGLMAIINANQQNEQPTGVQAIPPSAK